MSASTPVFVACITVFVLCILTFFSFQQMQRALVTNRIGAKVRINRMATKRRTRFVSLERAKCMPVIPVTIGCITVVVLVKSGVVLAVGISIMLFAGARVVLQSLRERRARAYEVGVLGAVEQLARNVGAGMNLVGAFRELITSENVYDGGVGRDLQCVVERMAVGQTFSESLHQWSREKTCESVRLSVVATTIAYETGGSPIRALEGAAETVRLGMTARENAKTHATQAQSSAFALSLLPIVLTGVLLSTNDNVNRFLLHTPIGAAVFVSGITLNMLGAWIMKRMIESTLS